MTDNNQLAPFIMPTFYSPNELLRPQLWEVDNYLEVVTPNNSHTWCIKWLAVGSCRKLGTECPFTTDGTPFHLLSWLTEETSPICYRENRKSVTPKYRKRCIVIESDRSVSEMLGRLQSWSHIFEIKIANSGWNRKTHLELWFNPNKTRNPHELVLLNNTFGWYGRYPPSGPFYEVNGEIRIRVDKRYITNRSAYSTPTERLGIDVEHMNHIIESTENPISDAYLQPIRNPLEQTESNWARFPHSYVYKGPLVAGEYLQTQESQETSESVFENPFMAAAEKLESLGDED